MYIAIALGKNQPWSHVYIQMKNHRFLLQDTTILLSGQKQVLQPAVENKQQCQNETTPKPSPCPGIRAQEPPPIERASMESSAPVTSRHQWRVDSVQRSKAPLPRACHC